MNPKTAYGVIVMTAKTMMNGEDDLGYWIMLVVMTMMAIILNDDDGIVLYV